jgi:hypothetical protein
LTAGTVYATLEAVPNIDITMADVSYTQSRT